MTSVFLAQLGLCWFMCGVTLSASLFGSDSFYSWLVIVSGFIFCVPKLFERCLRSRALSYGVLAFAFSPIFLYMLQALFLGGYSILDQPPLLYAGMSLTLLYAIAAGLLKEHEFRNVMFVVGVFHVGICFYALRNWNLMGGSDPNYRLQALGVRESVWAEVAVGSFVAGMLSGRFWLLCLCAVVAVMIILGAQMRGSGLAMISAFSVYAYYSFLTNRPVIRLVVISLFTVFLTFFYASSIIDFVSELFLLNDSNRGINSGFSGRFDNWVDGFLLFLESPIVGVGLNDPVAAYTHNGYLKIMAQFGIFYSLLMFYVLFSSSLYCYKEKKYDFFSSCVCYCVFIVSAPRYINMQLMPFVCLAAFSFIYLNKPKISVRFGLK